MISITCGGQAIPVRTDPSTAAAVLMAEPVVVLDTETTAINYHTAGLVGVAAFAPNQQMAFYLPCYSVVESVPGLDVVLPVIQQLFDDETKTLIFHHAQFDLLILRQHGLKCSAQIYDTLYAEHRLNNSYRSVFWKGDQLNYKLKTLTRRFLGEDQQTFEDATAGRPMQMVPVAQTAPYAAGDVIYTYRHFERQHDRLQLAGNAGIEGVLTNFDFPLFPMITEMLHRGIFIDLALADVALDEARARFTKRDRLIAKLVGRSVDVSKPGVLRGVLGSFKLPVGKSLSKASLEILRNETINRRAQTCIKAIISRRDIASTITKFLVQLQKRTDPTTGKLHVGNFQSLQETARFSASNPNIQALPDARDSSVRRLILPGKDRTIVAADFKNIEPRCLAQALLLFIAGKGKQLEAVKQANRDRAKKLFSDLLETREFKKEYEDVDPLPYLCSSKLAEFFITTGHDQDPYRFIAKQAFGLENPTKDERDAMKTITLGVIYGKSARSLAASMKKSFDETAESLNLFDAVMPELGVPTYENVNGHWKRREPEYQTYKNEVGLTLRHSGEITSLFGRKRRFPGLHHLRSCQRCRIVTQSKRGEYVWDVAPIQLWNYVLHAYIYSVRNANGTLIATESWRLPSEIVHRPSLTYWPFHQITYRWIRRIEIGNELVHFLPIEDCERQAFNSIIQMTAGDVFKLAMQRVQPVMDQFDAWMINNVHDELVFSVPTCSLHQFIPELRAAMEQKPMHWWTIPIKVDIEVGPNYGQLEEYKPTVPPEIVFDDPEVDPPDIYIT